jgi:arginine deiminase
MDDIINVSVQSEIGELEAVVLHSPGPEVENMTPLNAERALYSDILNLSVAKKEYSQLSCILSRYAKIFYIEDLLAEVLEVAGVKDRLVRSICQNECVNNVADDLISLPPGKLAKQLIEGVPIKKDRPSN